MFSICNGHSRCVELSVSERKNAEPLQLLRLKCEAYSTLNESDEDPNAESRLKEKMGFSGAQPPKPVLIAPAALYLTAILE